MDSLTIRHTIKPLCLFSLIVITIPGAIAQSSATLYGVLSEGIGYINNQGGKSSVQEITGTSQNNRIGFRGTEDLGGGLKALFTLENGFDITSGKLQQGGRMFGRQAFVGLGSTSFGSVTLGRQYDAIYDYLGEYSMMAAAGHGLGSHIGDNDNVQGTVRYNNSVKYRTPEWKGIQAQAMYAFSNAKGFAENRLISTGFTYQTGSFKVAVAFSNLDYPGMANNASGAAADDYLGAPFLFFHTSPLNSSVGVRRQREFGAAGQYRLNAFTLNAEVTDVRFAYLDSTSLHLTNYDLNLMYYITPVLSVTAGYTYTLGTYGGYDHAPHWNLEQVSIDYFLSKRTDVGFFVDYGQVHDGQAVFYSLSPASKNAKQSLAAVSIRHKF
ncbi:porin [Paraburkholderia sediminicola]|uniref:Porin n=1 Tax=Paraburkholderia metrosideri TaxID=580937 RepID=A0ABW9DSZ9_9BURK